MNSKGYGWVKKDKDGKKKEYMVSLLERCQNQQMLRRHGNGFVSKDTNRVTFVCSTRTGSPNKEAQTRKSKQMV